MEYLLDSSEKTHLAVCACGWRSPITFTRLAAATLLADHEKECHPGTNTRYYAARYERRRHADT